MRITIFFIISLFSITSIKAAEEIVLKGTYQEENLYVLNPFAATGVGFCVFEVLVNNKMAADEINTSSFELDLSAFNLKKGDAVEIKFKHKDDCFPKIINPEVLKPQSTFVVKLINFVDGNLQWTTTSEDGSLPFVVEQFRWKKWIKVDTIVGKGSKAENKYSATVSLHSGENKFRIIQYYRDGSPRYSDEFTYTSDILPVTFAFRRTRLTFSANTDYEIYNNYGTMILHGNARSIDLLTAEKGIYYINFDNQNGTFEK